jgi:hypothetical protein
MTVNGKSTTVADLRKGMVVHAERVVEQPATEITTDTSVVGQAPPQQAPKTEAAPAVAQTTPSEPPPAQAQVTPSEPAPAVAEEKPISPKAPDRAPRLSCGVVAGGRRYRSLDVCPSQVGRVAGISTHVTWNGRETGRRDRRRGRRRRPRDPGRRKRAAFRPRSGPVHGLCRVSRAIPKRRTGLRLAIRPRVWLRPGGDRSGASNESIDIGANVRDVELAGHIVFTPYLWPRAMGHRRADQPDGVERLIPRSRSTIRRVLVAPSGLGEPSSRQTRALLRGRAELDDTDQLVRPEVDLGRTITGGAWCVTVQPAPTRARTSPRGG